MKIVSLTREQFESFANNHPLRSHYQSYYYGQLLSEYYFDYDLIGYMDNNGSIKAAALILTKNITQFQKYAYSPKGFLIDYNDLTLVKNFTKDLKKYLKKRKVVMVKVNPEIIIGEIRPENNYKTVYNENQKLIEELGKFGYLKLRNNLYFESQFPRFDTVINLKDFNGLKSVQKNVRNKINKAERRGLTIETGSLNDLETFYDLIKGKRKRGLEYYRDYYNLFNKEGQIDLFLIKVDYSKFLLTAQKRYNDEAERNEKLIVELQNKPDEKTLQQKMQSDKDLASYKQDIIRASQNISNQTNIAIAGALVIKFCNSAYILISGFDQNYRFLNPNHYLHYKLIEHYKNLGFNTVDMNGMTGDFTKENPYYGLNKFKLGFNNVVYEYIGEFDLLVKKRKYKALNDNATLAREFNKPWEKKGDLNPDGTYKNEDKTTQSMSETGF